MSPKKLSDLLFNLTENDDPVGARWDQTDPWARLDLLRDAGFEFRQACNVAQMSWDMIPDRIRRRIKGLKEEVERTLLVDLNKLSQQDIEKLKRDLESFGNLFNLPIKTSLSGKDLEITYDARIEPKLVAKLEKLGFEYAAVEGRARPSSKRAFAPINEPSKEIDYVKIAGAFAHLRDIGASGIRSAKEGSYLRVANGVSASLDTVGEILSDIGEDHLGDQVIRLADRVRAETRPEVRPDESRLKEAEGGGEAPILRRSCPEVLSGYK